MIIVTGGSGQLGRGTVERLLERVPADRIGVSVRDVEKAKDLADRGVRVRYGDFAEPGSLAHAFEGASQVLIVSANAIGQDLLRLHRNAIDAAKAAGARRILYTSHMGANPSSVFPPMPDHAATEEMLRVSGVPFTSLRNGFYASTTVALVGAALRSGELAVPDDGPVSWTAHADLAEATAITLAEETFDGITPGLTGGEAIDMAGVAAIASELAGRPIKHVVVPDAEFRAGVIARGVPEFAAGMLVDMFAAARHGEFANVDPTLGHILHRPPTPLQDVLKAALSE
ncbi:SDR family oxidoreductase [Actinomadura bangladeshensis]|uniref:SDR family oxidoreductase n=1 Tax=Actinomadura bangladeshensis TaxID=453573 RepID=A0A4R4P5T7_9ACTN|nr:SDR family oxidoreductase [Actinomadura bangladeshensis]TDC17319.1 SDR family oxidoreductase [Actinomadura bangladeshensis]